LLLLKEIVILGNIKRTFSRGVDEAKVSSIVYCVMMLTKPKCGIQCREVSICNTFHWSC